MSTVVRSRPASQQRRDVVEEDARLREVGNVPDVLFEVHALSPSRSEAGKTTAGHYV